MKLPIRLAIDLMVVSLIGGVFSVNASAGALPGDPLYAVKRGWEGVRLVFTPDPQANQDLQAQLNAERLQEVQSLIQLHRTATVQFEAGLQAMDPSVWNVGNLPVAIQPYTTIEGTPQVGQRLWVQAQVQSNGALMAQYMRMAPHTQDWSPAAPPMVTRTPDPRRSSQSPWPTQHTGPMHIPMPSQWVAPMHTPMPSNHWNQGPMPSDDWNRSPMPSHNWNQRCMQGYCP